MFLKKFRPSSNGSRHRVVHSSITIESKKRRYFNIGYKKFAGRNKTGRLVIRGRVGHASNYLKIDFFRRTTTKLGVVINNVKNCNRNTLMALVKYSNGGYSYILSTLGFINGFLTQSIWRPERFSMKYVVGCAVFIKHIPVNSIFHSLEPIQGFGATIARSAGTNCLVIKTDHDTNLSLVRIPSGKILTISSYCLIILGKNHNVKFYKTVVGKCGANFRKGFKSKVRGIAMNPVDHPHGGRTKTNSPERNLWGKIAKLGK